MSLPGMLSMGAVFPWEKNLIRSDGPEGGGVGGGGGGVWWGPLRKQTNLCKKGGGIKAE